uniref:SH3 domain-containing protein n=1 Tax=Heterorhabditis bacteriophora TaxID=37862 RepID=A0A1I7X2I2_HETBA
MQKSENTFSVSAAKAFFETAKKPEVRNAVVTASKNPIVRSAAISAMKEPKVRNQLAAIIEKQYQAKDNVKVIPSRPSETQKPVPPPHRSFSNKINQETSATSVSTSCSSLPPTSHSHSNSSIDIPSSRFPPISSSTFHSTIISKTQGLQINTSEQRTNHYKPPHPVVPSHKSPVNSTFVRNEAHAIVKYPFTAKQFDELTSEIGDTVILKKEVDDQWLYGMNNRTGSHGIIPVSFLEIKVPLSTKSPSNSAVIATALYDYHSETPGDLQFQVNDQIFIIDRVNEDWLTGELHGKKGIFPANFVHCSDLPSVKMRSSPLEIMTAAYDYSSGVAGDLEFRAGDQIEVLEQMGSDWIRGRLRSSEGLAPLTFLSPLASPSSKSTTNTGLASLAVLGGTGRVVTAIADHNSDDPAHLYFSRGDRIIIVEDVNDYWYKGKLEGFRALPAGIFPKALVQ